MSKPVAYLFRNKTYVQAIAAYSCRCGSSLTRFDQVSISTYSHIQNYTVCSDLLDFPSHPRSWNSNSKNSRLPNGVVYFKNLRVHVVLHTEWNNVFIRKLYISRGAILLRNDRPPDASMICKVGEIQGQSTCYLRKRPSVSLSVP